MAKTALVISAHSADFVWRCGGAIALHEEKGYDVTVICLSYGERGESAKLWKNPGMTLEKVKTERRRKRKMLPRPSTSPTSSSSISAITRWSSIRTPSSSWST